MLKRRFRGLEKLYPLSINALLFIVLLLFVCVGKTSIQIVSALACVTLLAIVFNFYNEEKAKTRYIYIYIYRSSISDDICYSHNILFDNGT